MAMAPSKPLSFCFKPNHLGANSAACLDILPDTSLELQAAVLSNKPRPGDTLVLAKGTPGTDGGKDVVLGQDRSVVFHGSASGKTSFALILARDPATVLQELALAESGPFGLDLPRPGSAAPAGVVGSVVKAAQAIATFRAAEHVDPTLAMA